jgi:hypothetical protein
MVDTMRKTLLQLTQEVLNSVGGDAVTSINDTQESIDAAAILRQCFFDIISTAQLPEHEDFYNLTESSSATPIVMYKPTGIVSLDWVKYDNQDIPGPSGVTNYREVDFMPKRDFLAMLHSMDATESTIGTFTLTVDSNTLQLPHRTDKYPTYYTTLDDNTLLFDSYDITVEAYLHANRSLAWGMKSITWDHSDSAVPDLDHRLFNLLLQEAKATASVEMKQIENRKAETRARRAWINLSKTKHDVIQNGSNYQNPDKLPYYGRK